MSLSLISVKALGVDVSSSAAIAAYFGSLLDAQDKAPFGRGHYKIEKCTYCSYNTFKKADLRVEITVPEGAASGYTINSYAIDASGNKYVLSLCTTFAHISKE